MWPPNGVGYISHGFGMLLQLIRHDWTTMMDGSGTTEIMEDAPFSVYGEKMQMLLRLL